MRKVLPVVVAALVAVAGFASSVSSQSEPQAEGPPPPPPVRAIPGLTTLDPHPNACVDCHIHMKEYDMDVRISTLMAKWREGVEPKLLAAARAASVDSSKVTGKHPKVAGTRKDIPGGCLMCHGVKAKAAPAFARMIHLIHLTGGEANLYMGYYQGECTHCHKLDMKTGMWSIPSAVEPPDD